MVIDMNDGRVGTLEQLRRFLGGTLDVHFAPASDAASRRWRCHRSVWWTPSLPLLTSTQDDLAGRPISCPSSIRLSFCDASLRNTSPRCWRNCPYSVWRRHFEMNTT
jgi:hypothetical protein